MRNRNEIEIPEMELLERYLGIEKEKPGNETPETEWISEEREHYARKGHSRRVLWGILSALLVIAAVSVLVAMLWMPVLRIYGTSMTPTLNEGEIVVAFKGLSIENGDIVAFYSGNKLLIKRCVACSGQWVNMDEEGNLYVDGQLLEEDYVSEKALGDCDIEFPYQVPDGKWFLVGDHRSTSTDSRNSAVGCIAQEQLVGKVLLRIWPFERISDLR